MKKNATLRAGFFFFYKIVVSRWPKVSWGGEKNLFFFPGEGYLERAGKKKKKKTLKVLWGWVVCNELCVAHSREKKKTFSKFSIPSGIFEIEKTALLPSKTTRCWRDPPPFSRGHIRLQQSFPGEKLHFFRWGGR